MSEKEIRAAIDRICGDMDLRARRTARVARGAVFPFVLGAGLAVAACSDDESEPGPTTSNTTTSGSGGTGASGAAGGTAGSTSTAGSTASGGSGATGGAGGDGGMGNMGGMMPPYMAPDAYV